MKRIKVRDYFALMERIKASASETLLTTLGQISTGNDNYPILQIILGKGNHPRALISAGIHGDEPDGVEAILEFLEGERYSCFVDKWEITLLPCLNPWGYEHDRRENHENSDLNREFKSASPPEEIKLIQSVLNDPFDLALELHEDNESPGFYLYGKGEDMLEKALTKGILEAVEPVMPVSTDSYVEGYPMDKGLVIKACGSEKKTQWPMALYTKIQGTRICLTLETSVKFPIETRIAAYTTAIETALSTKNVFNTSD